MAFHPRSRRRTCFSMYPDFSHLRRMTWSMGTWASNHSWLMLSKQPRMSPSSTQRGCRTRAVEAAFDRIRAGPPLAKPIGVLIRRRLCHRIQCKQVEGLHGSVLHGGDAERTQLAVRLRDVDAPQRMRSIASRFRLSTAAIFFSGVSQITPSTPGSFCLAFSVTRRTATTCRSTSG